MLLLLNIIAIASNIFFRSFQEIACMVRVSIYPPVCDLFHGAESESVREAMARSGSTQWKSAMQGSYDSLIEDRAWELTDLPAGK